MIVILSSTIPCPPRTAAALDLSELLAAEHTRERCRESRTELRMTCRKCGASSVSFGIKPALTIAGHHFGACGPAACGAGVGGPAGL